MEGTWLRGNPITRGKAITGLPASLDRSDLRQDDPAAWGEWEVHLGSRGRAELGTGESMSRWPNTGRSWISHTSTGRGRRHEHGSLLPGGVPEHWDSSAFCPATAHLFSGLGGGWHTTSRVPRPLGSLPLTHQLYSVLVPSNAPHLGGK